MTDGHGAAGHGLVESGQTTSATRATSRPRRQLWWTLAVAVILVATGGLATFVVLRMDPPADTARNVAIVVYLSTDVTTGQKDAIGAYLRGLNLVGEIRYESHEDAYRRFVEASRDRPDIIAKVSPETLPESFWLTLADRADLLAVESHLAAQPGVDDVHVPSDRQSSPVPQEPSRRGEVTVFLRLDATTEQKETVAAYLRTLAVVDPMTFEDRAAVGDDRPMW
jgi:cell division protein FtsX